MLYVISNGDTPTEIVFDLEEATKCSGSYIDEFDQKGKRTGRAWKQISKDGQFTGEWTDNF